MSWLSSSGSSPRARGTQHAAEDARGDGRFIPAGAGNTRTGRVLPSALGGSSPRARGTRHPISSESRSTRFIPAGAGNTMNRCRFRCPLAVHPRGRGEHENRAHADAALSGSSPRARGTLSVSDTMRSSNRFIPAGAGNTIPARPRAGYVAVHPRGRREHSPPKRLARSASGSSPRARGAPERDDLARQELRFIPAGAGNTPRSITLARMAAVHPRGRGEHRTKFSYGHMGHGSSPRARGTRPVRPVSAFCNRFIPAGAGNTSVGRR